MNHSQVCHLFFSEKREDTNRNRTIFIHGNSIYSYGLHFPLGKEFEYKGKKYLFVNTYCYSYSTAKHQKHFAHAINKSLYEKVFYFDFLSPYGYNEEFNFEIDQHHFTDLFKRSNVELSNHLAYLMKAKTSLSAWDSFIRLSNLLQSLKAHFSEFCGDLNIVQAEPFHFEKVEKIKEAATIAQQKREEREKQEREKRAKEEEKKLSLWLTSQYNGRL